MSVKSQQANMKAIQNLITQDLGYIYGEKESGPNGEKRQYLAKSAAFLRAMAKEMGFAEYKVTTNPGGIAVSGEITLRGMWSDGNGLYFQINQPIQPFNSFLYRTIKSMKDYSGGVNQWMPCSLFADGEYDELKDTLMMLRKTTGAVRHAA